MPSGLEIVDIPGIVRAFGYVADEIRHRNVCEITFKEKGILSDNHTCCLLCCNGCLDGQIGRVDLLRN